MENSVPELGKKSDLKDILAVVLLTLAYAFAFIGIFFMYYLPEYLREYTCVFYREVIYYAVMVPSIASMTIGIVALIWQKIVSTLRKPERTNVAFKIMALAVVILSFWASQRQWYWSRRRSISYLMLCAHNLDSLGKAIFAYAGENDGRFPSASRWCDLLLEHTDVNEEQFICGESFWPVFSYGFNKNLDGLRVCDVPPDTVLLFEIDSGRNVSGGPESVTYNRHGESISVVLPVSGYSKATKKKWANELRWEVAENRGVEHMLTREDIIQKANDFILSLDHTLEFYMEPRYDVNNAEWHKVLTWLIEDHPDFANQYVESLKDRHYQAVRYDPNYEVMIGEGLWIFVDVKTGEIINHAGGYLEPDR